MEYRYLGKSGVQVSLLSLGSWVTFGHQIGDDISRELMHKAYDSGINFFDNAEVYANGKSEEVMGRILAEAGWDRTSYLVSSKVFFGDGRKLPNQTGLSRKHIREACEAALKRLRMDYLDLYYCHRPDNNVPMHEIVWTMNHLIQQGKILYWGTSEWSAQEIMEANMVAAQLNLIGPTMEQPEYNMFRREKIEIEFQQIFKNVGLGTTIWSPLASGLLTGKYLDGIPKDSRLSLASYAWLKDKTLIDEKLKMVKKLNEFALSIGTSLAKLAIAWCAKNQNVSSVILGATSMNQLTENLEALDLLEKLTQEDWDKVNSILN